MYSIIISLISSTNVNVKHSYYNLNNELIRLELHRRNLGVLQKKKKHLPGLQQRNVDEYFLDNFSFTGATMHESFCFETSVQTRGVVIS